MAAPAAFFAERTPTAGKTVKTSLRDDGRRMKFPLEIIDEMALSDETWSP
jgi:hypothetical protein